MTKMTRPFFFRRSSVAAGAALIAASCLAAVGAAQHDAGISGRIHIAGRHPINPPAGESRNSHAYFTIRGQGAVGIYSAMVATAEDDLCRGDGWKIKRAGDFSCSTSRDGKKAECDFAVELRQGTIAPGNPC